MNTEEIRAELYRLQDKEYGEFQKKLIPTVAPENIIGVRTPELRKLAKGLAKELAAEDKAPAAAEGIREFLDDLPHKYFDENQLHAFILSEMKDYEKCMSRVEVFLPYVDNWATCDQMSPKVFRKHRQELIEKIREWIGSERVYTVRFGLGMLMEHFLDGDFAPEYLELAASVRSEEYYVNMMTAWYFATALAKQWDTTIPYIEGYRLDAWTHNKSIQKARESYRITPEQKEYLRGLKIK